MMNKDGKFVMKTNAVSGGDRKADAGGISTSSVSQRPLPCLLTPEGTVTVFYSNIHLQVHY